MHPCQAPAAKTLADGMGAMASSSPIQRTITSNEAFTVLQNVRLRGPDPRVDQVVRFGDVGELRLSAGASTPAASRRRIDFAFETGYFDFKSLPFPLRLPYPVPFKLLGDEAKGCAGLWGEQPQTSRCRVPCPVQMAGHDVPQRAPSHQQRQQGHHVHPGSRCARRAVTQCE